MKISSTEEYGLRIMLTIARNDNGTGMTIDDIAKKETLSPAYAAKLLRALRIVGLVDSSPGKSGGYTLAKPASDIKLSEVLNAIGGKLYDQSFCAAHSSDNQLCTNSIDCSIRSLWQILQHSVDKILDQLSLADLMGSSDELSSMANSNNTGISSPN